jgi:hypothetical protein
MACPITYYEFAVDVLMDDLFDGRLEYRGITEYRLAKTDGMTRVLTDGKNYLWVFADKVGKIWILIEYADNSAEVMLHSIADELGVRIYSEYDLRFLLEAECEALQDEELYEQILRYIAGEAHELGDGTSAMAEELKIARALVSEDASLGARENRDKLLSAVRSAVREEFDRRNAPPEVKLDIDEITAEIVEAVSRWHPDRRDFLDPVP